MKMKTNLKIMLVLVVVLLATIVFNTNVVQAATVPKVIIQNQIMEDLIETQVTERNNEYNVYFRLNQFKIYDITKNTNFSQVTSDGYVYQPICIEIPSNTTKVIRKADNKELEIINVQGINYVKYDMKLFKKSLTKSEDIGYEEKLTLEYKENDNLIEEKIFNLYSEYNDETGNWENIEIVDENDNKFENNGGSGDTGWFQTSVDTENDYTNSYWKLTTNANLGQEFTIKEIGKFDYIGKDVNGDNLYKAKITNFSIFEKPQTLKYYIELVDKTTGKGSYNTIQIDVIGYGRKTHTVNDKESGIGISLNGSTQVGVTLTADTINKDSSLFVEMSNYLQITDYSLFLGAFDMKLTGGKYEGDVILTFNLGEEYNGKKVVISHKKQDGSFEHFEEIVKDGKVTIKVKELSPFMIALVKDSNNNEQENNKEDKKELDNEPKTGVNDHIILASVVSLISLAGIVALKFKK